MKKTLRKKKEDGFKDVFKLIPKPKVVLFDYNENTFSEIDIKDVEECFPFKEQKNVTWINVDGLENVPLVESLASQFGVHPLIIEDILHSRQRPKQEDFESFIFIVAKVLDFDDKNNHIVEHHLSIILGENFLITFNEKENEIFKSVRGRIRSAKGRIRKKGGDFLAYTLLDTIVDQYYVVLEKLGEKIDANQNVLFMNPTMKSVKQIQNLKLELIKARKAIWPLREVVSGLLYSDSKMLSDKTDIFFRDLYEHVVQIIDTIETYRDILSGMLEIYMSAISNKMNEVMKVLTIFSTIFIPMTFFAGVYGMNFKYFPELNQRWAYPVFWAAMAAIAIGMLIYFKRKKWI